MAIWRVPMYIACDMIGLSDCCWSRRNIVRIYSPYIDTFAAFKGATEAVFEHMMQT